MLKEQYPDMKSFQLYGELFGGNYNGKTEHGSKSVQKGVNYCPRNDFMAYDLRITVHMDKNTEKKEVDGNEVVSDNFFLSFSEIDEIIKNLALKIKLVPFIAKGTFNEMIELNPVFETRISIEYGLEPIPNNFAEGYVIKAEDEQKYPRIIFKHKNPDFLEVAPAKKVPNVKNLSFQSLCLEEMKKYITKNRFSNVYTKFSDKDLGELTKEEQTQLEMLMYNDIIVDFKDDHMDPDDLTCNEPNIIRNERPLKGMVKGFVKSQSAQSVVKTA
jgi:Rnl2 family RNA ligase